MGLRSAAPPLWREGGEGRMKSPDSLVDRGLVEDDDIAVNEMMICTLFFHACICPTSKMILRSLTDYNYLMILR